MQLLSRHRLEQRTQSPAIDSMRTLDVCFGGSEFCLVGNPADALPRLDFSVLFKHGNVELRNETLRSIGTGLLRRSHVEKFVAGHLDCMLIAHRIPKETRSRAKQMMRERVFFFFKEWSRDKVSRYRKEDFPLLPVVGAAHATLLMLLHDTSLPFCSVGEHTSPCFLFGCWTTLHPFFVLLLHDP